MGDRNGILSIAVTGLLCAMAAGAPDGTIMPTKKNQPPPDLKYFNQAKK
jgi:hypothetical protein